MRGVYDPIARRLYVRRGAGLRAALIHELVHALQDQAFDLRRLSSLRRGNRDAALAASAAVEGHATFATEVLGGRMLALRSPPTRGPASHGGSRIRLFLGLEAEFPYTTGLRFVTNLYNLGGKSAAFAALRRFPATSEQIFHIDAFLSLEPALPLELPGSAAGFSLLRDDSFGELDVRALLAIFQVPRLDHVGEGWGGGLSALYRDGAGRRAMALRLDWDSELDATQWGEAVAIYVNEAFEPDISGFPTTMPCGVDACWSVAGHSIAFRRLGFRTALAFAPPVGDAAALARSLLP